MGSENPTQTKRNFSSLSLKDAMLLLEQSDFVGWEVNAPPRPPSAFLIEAFVRFDAFNLTNSEAAKLLLIDALLAETVPMYPQLRVWKAAPLESNVLTGIADYLLAPKRAYLGTPLLCVVEAKKDDFEQGRAQCLAEMAACRWNNEQENLIGDIYGIVSNGQTWQFYRLTVSGAIHETEPYTIRFLPELLGVLDFVCAECAKNVPNALSETRE